MPRLGVNIDHVATLRQARGGREPDPVWAAVAGRAGRGRRDHGPPPRGPPAHPGPRPAAPPRDGPGPAQPGAGGRAGDRRDRPARSAPTRSTFVPERRAELTTEGGLDVVGQRDRVGRGGRPAAATPGSRSACSSTPTPRRSRRRRGSASRRVELHTGRYADSPEEQAAGPSWPPCGRPAADDVACGLALHAGHGLNYRNVRPVAR